MIFSSLPRTLRQQLGRPRACLCPLPKNSHCQGGDVTTKKRVTMEDVSQKAQVSLTTVSMILNKRADMSFAQETVQRVLDAARELGYKKPEFARTRPLTDSKTIVIVCPNITNAYYATIAQAIQRAAAKREYTGIILTTYRSAQREEDALEMAISLGVSGIIFTMMPQNAERIEEINRKIPIVVIGDRNTSLNVDTIELDNFKAGTLIGQHLLELGHRRMAFISTTLDAVNNIRRRRLAGLQEALEGKGATLQVLSRDITPEEELDNLNIEYATGLALTEECLKRYPKCTALVAVNDSVAYGVLDALTAGPWAEGPRRVQRLCLRQPSLLAPLLHGSDLCRASHSGKGPQCLRDVFRSHFEKECKQHHPRGILPLPARWQDDRPLPREHGSVATARAICPRLAHRYLPVTLSLHSYASVRKSKILKGYIPKVSHEQHLPLSDVSLRRAGNFCQCRHSR